MKRAIALAHRGEGYVEPNPMVGCVIVKNGRVVGEGYHRRYGGPHAEVNALAKAGRAARGATAYVTLEPCRHHGKTPPCTQALIQAGVSRVVVGARDPHATAGGGIRVMRSAGITVDVGIERDACLELIAPFTKAITTGLPYVTLKWAQTIDGAIATTTGDSQWISNAKSRHLVHTKRARVDAIMVGIGTALSDDPQLTARDVRVRRIARRVVVDPRFRLTGRSVLMQSLDAVPLTLAVGKQVLADHPTKAARFKKLGVDLFAISDRRDRHGLMNLKPLLRHLRKQFQATNILAEGGAGLHGALMHQGLADEMWVFTGPRLLGDGAGKPPFSLPAKAVPLRKMRQAAHWSLRSTVNVDGDVLSKYVKSL